MFARKTVLKSIILITLLGLIGCTPSSRPMRFDGTPQGFEQFLTRIDTLSQTARTDLVHDLVETIQQNADISTPLVQDSTALFLYHGRAHRVRVAGDWNAWQPEEDLARIDETDLFYLRMTLPEDARLDYKLVVDGVWIRDPLNPHASPGGYGENSELAMPGYVQSPEIHRSERIPHGTIEPFAWTPAGGGAPRDIRVYLPAGYNPDSETPYPVLYVHDGREYIELGSMINVLDYSIAQGTCKPLVVVFVDPVNREEEYWQSGAFLALFTDELMPIIQSRYNVSESPAERGVMGSSLGGVTALHFAYYRPDLFGLVAGQSSALWINNQYLIDLVETDTTYRVKYVLQWGQFESEDVAHPHERLVRVLRDKGYDVTAESFPEGGAWGNWRAHIDDILSTLYPVKPNEGSGDEE